MEKLFEKKTLAIITGGASGIGLALAQKCVKAGMFVFACDKDQHAVKYVMETYGQSIKAVHMDVSQSDDWVALKKIVDDEYSGRVALLVLNAGIKPESSFDSVASFHTTFNTNVFGVVCGIGALLPSVKASAEVGNRSAIVITGSKQGITNPPGYPAYNASKAAVHSIAEQLSFDLQNTERVSVHLLVPGWTHTGMGGRTPQTSLSKPDGAWWPEQVVEYLEKKMQEGQFWVLCPDNEVTESLDRARMLWSAGDAVEGRPPLSRWREDWKGPANRFVEGYEDTEHWGPTL